MKIARVFPTKTSMSPDDDHSYFGPPGLFVPEYDEIHISVSFTWDLKHANWLKQQWQRVAPVKIGGPALNGEGGEFTPGLYLRKGVIVTSRGCPNRCAWCFVRSPLKELKIHEGNNIVDNNVLACSNKHLDRLFSMLQSQRLIKFSGGFEPARVNQKIVDRLRSISLLQLYLAYDHVDNFKEVKRAIILLRKYFKRYQIGCFVLIGFANDTMDQAEGRLRQILEIGAMPFAMLYRNKKGENPQPIIQWRQFQRDWCRPALVKHR